MRGVGVRGRGRGASSSANGIGDCWSSTPALIGKNWGTCLTKVSTPLVRGSTGRGEVGGVLDEAADLFGEASVQGGVGEGAGRVEELLDTGHEDADGVGVGVAV